MKLHIGGKERRPDWTVLDTEDRPEVDMVGSCVDLSRFADSSLEAIYVSHVLEHLSHRTDMMTALTEWFRTMIPGGQLYVAVPDLGALARLFSDSRSSVADRWKLMRLIFGSQRNPYDFHYTGFDQPMLVQLLEHVGFVEVRRVRSFGLFQDTSNGGISPGDNPDLPTTLYSLNVVARKPDRPT